MARLKLTRHERPEDFERTAFGFLLGREAEHNLILGLTAQLKAGDPRYPEWYLATVGSRDTVVAAALRTPPFHFALSHVDDADGVRLLVHDLHDEYGALPGVLGRPVDARAFADAWCTLCGQTPRVAMRQRIHAAEDAKPPEGVPGRMRGVGPGDRDLVVPWLRAFQEEADPRSAQAEAEDLFAARTTRPLGGLVVWEEGAPVSIAGYGGPTPNGIRIGPVYTPPELRGRGYASACVASLTRRLLDEGRRFCFLYTDLANQVSNKIYARIGYEPVCDVDRYAFS